MLSSVPAVENSPFVCHQVALIVELETRTMPGRLVYDLLNVLDREIEDSKYCWSCSFTSIARSRVAIMA
jgi:hypothetical protein